VRGVALLALGVSVAFTPGCNWVLGLDQVGHSDSAGSAGAGSGALSAGGSGTAAIGGTGAGADAATEATGGGGAAPPIAEGGGSGERDGGEGGDGGEHENPPMGGAGSGGGGSVAGGGGSVAGCNPGVSPRDAGNLGDPTQGLVVCERELVRGNVPNFYQFTLSENATITYSLEETSGVAAAVYEQREINDWNDPLDSIDASRPSDPLNLEKRSYFLRVTAPLGDLYTLRVMATSYVVPEPTPEPGDASDPHVVPTLVDDGKAVEFGGYVGKTDEADFYQLELSKNGSLTFALDEVKGAVIAKVYLRDSFPQMVERETTGAPVTVDLGTGFYLLEVTPSSPVPSLYTLAIQVDY
jgi:hypothetical protein